MTEIKNLWEEYGFALNPYHTQHLDATAEDADLYVHREGSERELGTFLASEDEGAVFVEGHVGVGKTTFINQTQYLLLNDDSLPDILPSTSIVEVLDSTTPDTLVLSVLTAVLKSLRHHDPDAQEDERFQELEAYTKKARITSWKGGGTVMGTGMNVEKNVTTNDPVTVPLQTLQALLDEVSPLVLDYGFDKVVVLLNNLDSVPQEHFFQLLHDLRDTLLGRPGWLFVFAGPDGLRQDLSSTAVHRRISERIVSQPVALGPLTKEEVHKVIDKRVAAYQLHEDAEAPVPRSSIDILYDASGGEIRYVLNRAQGIARRVGLDLPTPGPIEEDVANAALQKIVRDEIESRELTTRQMEVLADIVKAGSVQPKDHEQFGFNSSPALTRYLTTFHENGLLEREKRGRETIYTPRGDVTLYFEEME